MNEGLPEEVSRGLGLFGVKNTLRIIGNNERALSFRISAEGPLNTGQIDMAIVYVEMSRRESVLRKPIPVRLDYPAYQLPVKNLIGMDLNEVGAEKIRAIITRHEAKDIYDLYHLIENKGIEFDQGMADRKLGYYGKRFSSELLLDKVSEMERYYSKELGGMLFDRLPLFGSVIKSIKAWIT